MDWRWIVDEVGVNFDKQAAPVRMMLRVCNRIKNRGTHGVVLLMVTVALLIPVDSIQAVSRLAKLSPTHFHVRYGPERRQLLDLWRPESGQPAPLLGYFHGGGFKQGGKHMITPVEVQRALENGFAIASVQYQFVHREGLGEPERAGVHDVVRGSARAVQFLRYHADKYGIDKTRVACFGESAGAGISLWIGCHDDIADPGNPDPVLRESTRVSGVGVTHGQFTYDLEKWIPEFSSRFGGGVKMFDSVDHAAFFGLTDAEYEGPEGKRRRAQVDMISLMSHDDPPIIMVSYMPDRRPMSIVGFSHHPLHVELMEKRSREVGLSFTGLMTKVRKEDKEYVKQHSQPVVSFLMKRLEQVGEPVSEGVTIQAQPVE